MNAPNDKPAAGCSFLLHPIGTERIFTPEHFSEEQRMFARTAEEFMEKEIEPDIARLEKLEEGLMVAKLKKAGELGLLMIDVPEAYGGLELDKTTSMLCAEKLATYASFSVSHGAHTGIGSMPLMYFGNDEQKAKYLPRLATGEWLAAYALTEPGSGSDALGARTVARYEEDADGNGWYVLNGTKMWITNAGFADLFTVFAKVDGDKFSAFLVESTWGGVSTGAEEHKMGIKGSSTRMLILEDVRVPAENLLGEVGRGHKIAFNILNVGRFKLGVGVLGGAKRVARVATEYAKERKQFGQPIAEFGAIQGKIASMYIKVYALEAMCYRVAGYMDRTIDAIEAGADDYVAQVMDAIEEFAVEDSIMKVFGSEVTDFVVDEAVQIHGGYGFSAEYSVERTYRDSRINRIFEGTNEINRMLIPGTILKRTMKGQLDLFSLVQDVEAMLDEGKQAAPRYDVDGVTYEMFLAEQAKRLTVFLANTAIQKHMADFKDQQEMLLALADMFIFSYGIDSTVARVKQNLDDGRASDVHLAIAQVFATESYSAMLRIAEQLLPSLASGDELCGLLDRLDHFVYRPPCDIIRLKRRIAAHALEHPKYNL